MLFNPGASSCDNRLVLVDLVGTSSTTCWCQVRTIIILTTLTIMLEIVRESSCQGSSLLGVVQRHQSWNIDHLELQRCACKARHFWLGTLSNSSFDCIILSSVLRTLDLFVEERIVVMILLVLLSTGLSVHHSNSSRRLLLLMSLGLLEIWTDESWRSIILIS